MCLFILLSAAHLRKSRSARNVMNRVSFRLLLVSLAMEVLYDGVYIGLYANVPCDSVSYNSVSADL